MLTQSAKAKGRRLQQIVRDAILKAFPSLTERDVVSTSMGTSGVDVQLSEAGFKCFPWNVECKNLARVAVYRFIEQGAKDRDNAGKPLVVVKENGKQPLAIVYFEDFMELVNDSKR